MGAIVQTGLQFKYRSTDDIKKAKKRKKKHLVLTEGGEGGVWGQNKDPKEFTQK